MRGLLFAYFVASLAPSRRPARSPSCLSTLPPRPSCFAITSLDLWYRAALAPVLVKPFISTVVLLEYTRRFSGNFKSWSISLMCMSFFPSSSSPSLAGGMTIVDVVCTLLPKDSAVLIHGGERYGRMRSWLGSVWVVSLVSGVALFCLSCRLGLWDGSGGFKVGGLSLRQALGRRCMTGLVMCSLFRRIACLLYCSWT